MIIVPYSSALFRVLIDFLVPLGPLRGEQDSYSDLECLKQHAKSRYSGILGFEVRRNLKIFYSCPNTF
jgi:hypothetical protein